MKPVVVTLAILFGVVAHPSPAHAEWRCPRAVRQAARVGWPLQDLAAVDYIVYRESRCAKTARSTSRDTGLMQINDIHLGWLAAEGITAADLYRAKPNLRAGRLLYLRALQYYGCGWQPWRTSSWRPC